MLKNIVLSASAIALVAVPVVGNAADTFGINLKLSVAQTCRITQQSAGPVQSTSGQVSLGTFQEYCNAPRGYRLVAYYTPGTLNGARLSSGADEVTLDGSGQATVTTEIRPRFRQRELSIAPGANGFDTRTLKFDLIAN